MSALKSLCGGHIVGKDLRRLLLKPCLQSKHRIFTLCMYLSQPGGQRPQKAVVQSLSCLTPCNPTNCSTPGFPVHHHLPESAQTHVHWVMCIQPFRPLSSPSPPALNLSQHQGLFQWVGGLHHVAKILELQLQHQSFHWIFRADFLYNWLAWSPWSPRDPQESSPAPQFKASILSYSAFFMVQLSHPCVTTGKTMALTKWTFVSKVTSLFFTEEGYRQ